MKRILLIACLVVCMVAHTQVNLNNDSTLKPNSENLLTKQADIQGFYSTLEVGYLFGPGQIDPASISMSLSYQLENNLSLAAATGIEYFQYPVMPVYGQISYIFEGMKIAPIAYFQAGYSFPLKQPDNYYYWDNPTEAKGGLIVNPGIGMLLPLNENTLFNISIGFRYQELNFHRHLYWLDDDTYITDIYKRLNLRVGLCFN